MGPAVETEIKLRMADAETARRALGAIGAAATRERHFEDNRLFDDAGRSLLKTGRALRVRRADGRVIVTFKGPRVDDGSGVKSRPEVEVDVADADAFEAVLAGLGYRRVFRYQKDRTVFRWQTVEIVLDETPIGTFVEIEGAVDAIHEAARALGRPPEDYIGDSYAALYMAAGRTGDMVF